MALLVNPCSAHPRYMQAIPAIPMVDGAPWPGVGHLVREGGGPRNPFGLVSRLTPVIIGLTRERWIVSHIIAKPSGICSA